MVGGWGTRKRTRVRLRVRVREVWPKPCFVILAKGGKGKRTNTKDTKDIGGLFTKYSRDRHRHRYPQCPNHRVIQ
jgi:hypothetical protein